MRATSLAVGLVLFFLLGGRVSAQGTPAPYFDQMKVQRTTPHHLDPMKRTLVEPVMALHYAKEIGLTEEQRIAIQNQLKEAKAKFVVLEKKLEGENQALFKLIDNPGASEQTVVEQMDRVLSVEREIKVTNLLSSWRVRQVLSAEQRETLKGLKIPPPPPPPPPPQHAPGAPLRHSPAPPAPLRHGPAPAAPRQP